MKTILTFLTYLRPGGRLAWPVALVLLLAGSGLVYAQSGGQYTLTWWTVDNGGSGGGIGTTKRVTGGQYDLLSTAGQPEAQAAALSGGSYTLQSGFWPGELQPLSNVYLPALIKSTMPDLVGSFSLSPAGPAFTAGQPVTIQIVVTNQGTAPAAPFWVDFYINPSATPTVNQRWNDLCALTPCYGLAWYVGSGLAQGQSITLNSNNYAADYSIWPGSFVRGTTNLYLLVDSWNPTMPVGGVAESSESNNLSSLGGISVTGLEIQSQERDPASLPPRPARLED